LETQQNEHIEFINRQSVVSGRFYPGSEIALAEKLDVLFKQAEPNKHKSSPIAIISPHAGYPFSGSVAASSYNQLPPTNIYENIFVIGSSHYTSFNGASVYHQGNYVTPLGEVKVNVPLAKQLIEENDVFTFNTEAHSQEHSLEVQLPFLQYKYGTELQIIPIIVATQRTSVIKKIAEALHPYFNEKNLFVISTDFSHYPPYDIAKQVDLETAESIVSNSTDKFIKSIHGNMDKGFHELHTCICGWSSVLTLLHLTENNEEISHTIVDYKNSGDNKTYGDKSGVVGYYSIRTDIKKKEKEFNLSDEEKIFLLKAARNSIESKFYSIDKQEQEYPSNLKVQTGAFVTLHKDGKLRGCIGKFKADKSLVNIVEDVAVSSAFHDTRFEKLTPYELNEIEIEISVLTPLKKIESIDEFELGIHGIYIKKGHNTGTFLPQVAHETNWNKEEFLGYCSKNKAGLGWDGWKDAELYTYEAIIFSENDFKKQLRTNLK
jgi:AmmeMemoRadiSam system protein B/AmmeMemoRadiSam system protein A